eukprot:5094272-Pyramimonas_sp.AAC.1
MCAAGPDGAMAVRSDRGAAVAEIYRACPERITPCRRDKWKDQGADCDDKLGDSAAPKNFDAKPIWIIHGSHDPDIAML